MAFKFMATSMDANDLQKKKQLGLKNLEKILFLVTFTISKNDIKFSNKKLFLCS